MWKVNLYKLVISSNSINPLHEEYINSFYACKVSLSILIKYGFVRSQLTEFKRITVRKLST